MKLRIVVVLGSCIFSIHDGKSEFPLSIYIILGILQIEWIRQLGGL